MLQMKRGNLFNRCMKMQMEQTSVKSKQSIAQNAEGLLGIISAMMAGTMVGFVIYLFFATSAS